MRIDNATIARRYSIAMAAYFRHSFQQGHECGRHCFTRRGWPRLRRAAGVKGFLNLVPSEVKTAFRGRHSRSHSFRVGVEDDSWVDRLVDLLDKVEREVASDSKLFKELIATAASEQKYGVAEKLKKTLETNRARQPSGSWRTGTFFLSTVSPVDTVDLSTPCTGRDCAWNATFTGNL